MYLSRYRKKALHLKCPKMLKSFTFSSVNFCFLREEEKESTQEHEQAEEEQRERKNLK